MFYYIVLIISFFLLFLSIIILIFSISLLFTFLYTKVPYVRTPKKVLKIILNEIKLKPVDVVYDLGCGNARFLIMIKKQFGAKTIGYELSLWPYILARLNILLNKSKTKVFNRNFYKENLSNADLIFCFLLTDVMPKVQKQLEKQLKKGAKVISFSFSIKDWKPYKTIETKPGKSKIYFYQR